MGRAPSGARITWYEEFPFLRALCHGVVEHNVWSEATLAPTEQAWGGEPGIGFTSTCHPYTQLKAPLQRGRTGGVGRPLKVHGSRRN